MIDGVTGAVLAGGRSRRFGSDKALAPWGASTLVESVVDSLSGLFEVKLIVVKTDWKLAHLADPNCLVVPDGSPEHCPLAGLRCALAATTTERVFVCACDMPFLRPDLIEALCRASAGFDAVVPIWQGHLQPLCAVYSKSCLATVERLISEGRLSIRDFFPRVRTHFFTEAEVRVIDPEGRSFVDLDTAQDYASASASKREAQPVGD